MAKKWKDVLDVYGAAWRVTPAEIAELGDLINDAELALAKVQDKASRNHEDTVHCNEVFKKMTEFMRYLKKNFFNMPPRTAEEIAKLGLDETDKHSNIPPPDNVVSVDSRPVANGLIELVFHIIGSVITDRDESDYGYRVYLGVEDASAAPDFLGKFGRYLPGPPASGGALSFSFFTHRKHDVVECDERDRGKKIWVAVRLENQKGEAGHWGPLMWTIIP
jgi:hypothetical protein